MQKIITINKPIGKTPLDMILELKVKHPELKNTKLAYAGRLDPMAEGLLIILVGEECKNRDKYERLTKEYEFEILVGVSTDSYDVLGKVHLVDIKAVSKVNMVDVISTSNQFLGTFDQLYPPYSSARVQGKPLFYWARNNKLNEIKFPSKKIEVNNIKFVSQKTISSKELLIRVTESINLVTGEFRQQEIIKKWQEALMPSSIEYPILCFTISCSSGTYVRSIANDFGKKLGIPSLALSIKRTKVGDIKL